MTTIQNVNVQRFSCNGIEYYKNFLSKVVGNTITIYNAYDSRDELVSNEKYQQVTLNGTIYTSVALLQQALLVNIFNRDTLGNGSTMASQLNYIQQTNGGIVNNDIGTDAVLTLATPVYAGLMSPADKIKVDAFVNFDPDADGIIDEATRMVTVGRNSTGGVLHAGTVVYIQGSTGNRPNYTKARANSEITSAGTFGVICADIQNNADGKAVTVGTLNNLNTNTALNGNVRPFTVDTLVDGDKLYLHPTLDGFVTNIKPSAPNHIVYIGNVVRTHPNLGTIVYRIQNGFEIEELHNVAISALANNDYLIYDSATSLWKNKPLVVQAGSSTQNPYTVKVNNTPNIAFPTEKVFRNNGQQQYTGTIEWQGFPGMVLPNPIQQSTFNWSQVGNVVTLGINLGYQTQGSLQERVILSFPTGLPAPVIPPTAINMGLEFCLQQDNHIVQTQLLRQ